VSFVSYDLLKEALGVQTRPAHGGG